MTDITIIYRQFLSFPQHERDKLVYKGKVGTGFGAETMAGIMEKLHARARKTAARHIRPRRREASAGCAPVSWEELRDVETPAAFSISDVEKLLQRASGKALRGWGFAELPLPDL